MARLFLVSEPNLHTGQDAYLPPHCCNLGTAQLAGHCLGAGHEVRLVSFFHEWLDAFLGSEDGLAWTLDHIRGGTPEPFSWLGGDRAGIGRRLRAIARLASSPSLADMFHVPALQSLSRAMKDLRDLSLRDADSAEHPLVRRMVHEASRFDPDRVGISFTSVSEPWSRLLARRLADAGFRVVAGGSALDSLSGPERETFFLTTGVAEFVVGAGEIPLATLLSGSEPAPNTYRRVGGEVVVDRLVPGLLPDEDFPPAFHLLDLDRYYFPERILPVQLGRGCYWKKCTFCRRDVFRGDRIRHDPERVAERVVDLSRRFRTRLFSINDEALDPGLARRFSEALVARLGPDHGLSFFAAARPERRFTPEILATMARGGLKVVFWGVESGSPRILRRMRKGTSVPGIERVLRDASAAGITNLCFFLLGFPGEQPEDWEKTLDFWRRNHPYISYNRLNPFVLEEGSHLFEHARESGLEIGQKAPMGGSWTYRSLDGMSHERILEIRDQWAQEVANDRLRVDDGRFFEPPCPGKGDEKLLFLFAQRVYGARLLKDGEEAAPGDVLLPLTAEARRVLQAAAPERPGRETLAMLARARNLLCVSGQPCEHRNPGDPR